MERKETRFVVVSGGVISGVGKGIVTASIGKILKMHGYKTTLIKIDPYINYDAGTLRPTEHGEVWVTHDGGEIDQDLGTYERFMGQNIPKQNNITTGQIYKTVIDRERAGQYLGQTVQFIPHIIDEIIDRIKKASVGYDMAVIEVGGTVGDYENAPFLFALKALEQQLRYNAMAYVFVTYLPVPAHISEMKTRPTRQAVRLLGEHGIIPDFIVCRAPTMLDDTRKRKLQEFCYLPTDRVIAAPDLQSVYQMPLEFERQKLGVNLLDHFQLTSRSTPDWADWQKRVADMITPEQRVRIAIVGKYLKEGDYTITDSYVSICHALQHAGAELQVGVDIVWLDAHQVEHDQKNMLHNIDGILVPGGFGTQGVNGKLQAIAYARTRNVPYLGICYGFQLAVIEYARTVCGFAAAHTTEVAATSHPVIDTIPLQKELLEKNAYGGTMRLGDYEARIKPGSRIHNLYKAAGRIKDEHDPLVSERHRHRFEVNPAYIDTLEQSGLVFSGRHTRADNTQLMEFAELPQHRFFVATQAHPEFKSRFGDPHPLFIGLVGHAREYQKER